MTITKALFHIFLFTFFLALVQFIACNTTNLEQKITDKNKSNSEIEKHKSKPEITILNQEFFEKTYFDKIAIQAKVYSFDYIEHIYYNNTENGIPYDINNKYSPPFLHFCYEVKGLHFGDNTIPITIITKNNETITKKINITRLNFNNENFNTIKLVFTDLKSKNKELAEDYKKKISSALHTFHRYYSIIPSDDEKIKKLIDRFTDRAKIKVSERIKLGQQLGATHLLNGLLEDYNNGSMSIKLILDNLTKEIIEVDVDYTINITNNMFNQRIAKTIAYDIVRALTDRLIMKKYSN